jgi:hypothetical protein
MDMGLFPSSTIVLYFQKRSSSLILKLCFKKFAPHNIQGFVEEFENLIKYEMTK